ncbi:glycosyltransferase [Alsobacter sp. R-9]
MTLPPVGAPELAVIIPTFNEVGNVRRLVSSLEAALAGIHWEAIFVDDDSNDGTPDELEALAREDHRVRCIRRIGRRGLSTAVVEGMLSTVASYVAVIDADHQHDETKLVDMLAILRADEADIVVGSRYVGDGSIGAWDAGRARVSRVATTISRLFLPLQLSDPMSGFFMMPRALVFDAVRNLSGQGYKILLDIIMSLPIVPRVKEVAYTFRTRTHGESKLDSAVALEYLLMLVDKKIGHVVPTRFVLFGLVGGSGVLVHMATLAAVFGSFGSFRVAQAVATLVAMTFNFFVNNVLTYRDKRLRGVGPVVKGLLSFWLVCSIGAVSNVGVASVLFERDYAWWLSALAGIAVGVVWNYAMTATFTWRK